MIIENKPWASSSFTTLNETGQMERYADELEKIDAQGKTLCLLATEANKDYLLQEMATEARKDVTANEKSLRKHYTEKHGIDFVLITWQQVLKSLGSSQLKYAVVKFCVKELQACGSATHWL